MGERYEQDREERDRPLDGWMEQIAENLTPDTLEA